MYICTLRFFNILGIYFVILLEASNKMGKMLNRFLVTALILCVAIIFISQLLFSSIFETYRFPGRTICIVFVWLVTCVSYYWLMKTVTDKPKAFNRVFMMQTTIKLLLYMVCILVYLLFYKQYAIPFAVQFLVVYLIFAVFEVISILKFVKSNTGQTSGNIKMSN